MAMARSFSGTLREEDIQHTIVQGLGLLGYDVLQTSRRGIVCKRCGQKTYGGDGADKGVPDLLITHDSWPKCAALMMECKGPRTRVSPEQRDLERRGRTVIVRSWEEAIAAVRAFEGELKHA